MYQLEITLNSTFTPLPTLNNNLPPSRQFSRDIMLLKKISLGKGLLNTLLKLNRGCLGSRSYILLKLVIFMTKQKSSKANLLVNDLVLKMLQKAKYRDSPDQAKSQNFTPKCKILNVFWTVLTWSKGRDLFNWLSNLKNFVLSNGSKNVRNVIQMAFK